MGTQYKDDIRAARKYDRITLVNRYVHAMLERLDVFVEDSLVTEMIILSLYNTINSVSAEIAEELPVKHLSKTLPCYEVEFLMRGFMMALHMQQRHERMVVVSDLKKLLEHMNTDHSLPPEDISVLNRWAYQQIHNYDSNKI